MARVDPNLHIRAVALVCGPPEGLFVTLKTAGAEAFAGRGGVVAEALRIEPRLGLGGRPCTRPITADVGASAFPTAYLATGIARLPAALERRWADLHGRIGARGQQ